MIVAVVGWVSIHSIREAETGRLWRGVRLIKACTGLPSVTEVGLVRLLEETQLTIAVVIGPYTVEGALISAGLSAELAERLAKFSARGRDVLLALMDADGSICLLMSVVCEPALKGPLVVWKR